MFTSAKAIPSRFSAVLSRRQYPHHGVLNMVMVPAEGGAVAADIRDLLKSHVVGDPINLEQPPILPRQVRGRLLGWLGPPGSNGPDPSPEEGELRSGHGHVTGV
jgi:hypothetical protein